MPLPNDTPAIFDEILSDYRHGTINADTVRSRIADAVRDDPSLHMFKTTHLAWTDYDDTVEWLETV